MIKLLFYILFFQFCTKTKNTQISSKTNGLHPLCDAVRKLKVLRAAMPGVKTMGQYWMKRERNKKKLHAKYSITNGSTNGVVQTKRAVV